MSAASEIITADSITKVFGPTRALDNVTIAFNPGEVHGLIGENGAGKSTLIKILSGIERPTSGRVIVRGSPAVLSSVQAAQKRGIAMVHQELNLIDELTISENIFLGREETRCKIINRGFLNQLSRQILARLGSTLHPSRKVSTLSIAQKQMVEIARGLSTGASILMMDEPTAVLTEHEAAALFKVIDQLRNQNVAVIYVSHNLPHVLKICNRISVMRDGKMVYQISPERMPHTNEKQLANLMVGRPMSHHFPPRSLSGGVKIFEIDDFSYANQRRPVSFFVRSGEILGFAGLIGAGRTELAEALVGLRGKTRGSVILDGQFLHIATPRDAVDAGIAYLSENRKETGLMLEMNITSNITMVSLKKYTTLLTRRRAEDAAARKYIQALRIKTAGLRQLVRFLSGGNQQKVALAKWLEIQPRILIVDEPTRGIDVGAKEEIYRLLRELTAGGMACILISSEMNEILGMSDRIAVMRNNQIVATLDGAAATEHQIMQHAAGVAEVAA